MSDFNTMSKVQLRAACKAVSIKNYGNMTNDQMRAALQIKPDEMQKMPVDDVQHDATQVLADEIGSNDPTDEEIAESNVPAPEVVAEQAESEGPMMSSSLAMLFGQGVPSVPSNVVTHGAKQVSRVADEARAKGYTIEKERDESNGVKRPSAGTICAHIWDTLTVEASKGSIPTMQFVRTYGEQNGINEFTMRTQYARWRKFNNIVGRV